MDVMDALGVAICFALGIAVGLAISLPWEFLMEQEDVV